MNYERSRNILRSAWISAVCVASLIWQVSFAAYPERPIRLLVPSSPGSGPDAVARVVAARMSTLLGQQVFVENRAGANGVIASELVARAEPDGYTVLITTGGHTINPHMYRKLPYDPITSFTPVTLFLKSGGLVVVVTPSFGARSMAQLIEMARAAPDKIAYASAGRGNPTHLTAEMFRQAAGVRITHVPYKGGGPAINAVVGGEVPLMFASGSVAIPHVKSGRLRALGYTGTERSEQLPDVPTLDESGLKGFSTTGWYGLFGPARMPPAIVNRLREAARDAARHPETRQALAQLGLEPADLPPAEFARFLKEDLERYGRVIKAAGIEPE